MNFFVYRLAQGLILCILAVVCHFAHAETAETKEWAFGAHLVSFHKPGTGMRTITPGAYVLHVPTGATLGAYRNSEGRFSAYAGITLERGPWQLTAGIVTGYAKRNVLPMLAPSYKFDNGLRISIIPNPFGQSAVHLSKEFR